MSEWLERARRWVERRTADLPADATLKERRKRLVGQGHPFHGGTRWGRRQYGKAVREYLERHGQPSRKVEAAPNFGPDIIFPWRGKGGE